MILGIIIASLFAIEGLRNISRFIIYFFQWKQSQEWHKTHGRIIQSDLKSVVVPRGGRKGYDINGFVKLTIAYTPDILYEYRANAESFQSKQIFIGQKFPSSLDFSNDFVEKYPAGKNVTVFYNPEKPDFSVLEREWRKELFGYLIGGALCLLFGFGILAQVIYD
jgi:hypothetical protein